MIAIDYRREEGGGSYKSIANDTSNLNTNIKD